MVPYSNRRRKSLCRSASPSTVVSKVSIQFKAPTPGYEHVHFTASSTKDTTQFKDSWQKLACQVATSGWEHALVVERAMDDLREPDLVEPVRLVQMYYHMEGTEIKVRVVRGKLPVTVLYKIN